MSICESSRVSTYQTLLDLCREINQNSPIKHTDEFYNIDLHRIKQHAKNVLELRPSGPRQGNIGTKQEEQGIVYSAVLKEGGVVIAATLLAAGFVVGSQGSSIKQICEATCVSSKSWFTSELPLQDRPCLRVFYMEGSPEKLIQAIRIIVAAVNRYRELVNGQYKDLVVDVKQQVMGLLFEYKPPPIHTMPEAARTIDFQGAKPSEYGRQKAAERERSQMKVSTKEKCFKDQLFSYRETMQQTNTKMMKHKYDYTHLQNRQYYGIDGGTGKCQSPSTTNTPYASTEKQQQFYTNANTTTYPNTNAYTYSYSYPVYANRYCYNTPFPHYPQYPNYSSPMQPAPYLYPSYFPYQNFGPYNTTATAATQYFPQFQPHYMPPALYVN